MVSALVCPSAVRAVKVVIGASKLVPSLLTVKAHELLSGVPCSMKFMAAIGLVTVSVTEPWLAPDWVMLKT
jgi:hypothetical protein